MEEHANNRYRCDRSGHVSSGKLLAVGGGGLEGGGGGFQIFHFNGSSPITKDSGILQSSVQFNAFAWDSANHLFALGDGQLYVYTVTTSSVTEAPARLIPSLKPGPFLFNP